MEHQASSALGSAVPTTAFLCLLPLEITEMIIDCLDQRDINHLIKTCRKLAFQVQPMLLRQDIEDNVYNSLTWACYHGDTDLARTCLEAGASPNAVFCVDGKACGRLEDVWDYNYLESPIQSRLAEEGFEYPVFPTREFSGKLLLRRYKWFSASALTLAVQRDHDGVVRLLLDAGADVVIQRKATPLDGHSRETYAIKSELVSHDASISYVRSLRMAKLLLQAGGNAQLGHAGPTDLVYSSSLTRSRRRSAWYIPLEVILRCHCAKARYSEPRLSESELYALVTFLLGREAFGEQGWMRQHRFSTTFQEAIQTQYFSVARLLMECAMLHSGNWSLEGQIALGIVLSFCDEHDFGVIQPLMIEFARRLVGMLVDAGVSLDEHVPVRRVEVW